MLIRLIISNKRSTSVFMFSFGGGVVCWNNKKRPTITLSSMEIEYKGAIIITCELIWLQKLFLDLEQLVDVHIIIYCDNISNILIT